MRNVLPMQQGQPRSRLGRARPDQSPNQQPSLLEVGRPTWTYSRQTVKVTGRIHGLMSNLIGSHGCYILRREVCFWPLEYLAGVATEQNTVQQSGRQGCCSPPDFGKLLRAPANDATNCDGSEPGRTRRRRPGQRASGTARRRYVHNLRRSFNEA